MLSLTGRRHPADPGLSRTQEHHAYGQVHEIGTRSIQRTILNMRTGAGDGITFDQNANATRGQSGRRGGPPKAVIKEAV